MTGPPVDITAYRVARSGGIERYTWEVAHALAQRGSHVRVACGRGSEPPPNCDVVLVGNAMDVNTYRGGVSSLAFPLRARRALGRRSSSVRYGPLGAVIGPAVVTAHSVHAAWMHQRGAILGQHKKSAYDYSQVFLEQLTYRSPSMIVTTVSPPCADQLSEFYGREREEITVIAPAIDSSEFDELAPEERHQARVRLGLRPDEFTVGMVANYAFANKGVATTVYACREVGATLVVAGILDRHAKAFAALAEKEGVRLLLPGHVRGMRQFYGALDVLAMPSVYEAYGMAAHEAMACGVPAIMSETSGIAAVVTPRDDNLTVVPNDVDDLVRALGYVAGAGTRAALMAESKVWARARTWSDAANELLDVVHRYGEILIRP